MNLDTINALFRLFSGVTNVEEHAQTVQSAMDEVTQKLVDSSNTTDERLNYVCASLANLRYQQYMASRDRLNYTYAGTVAQKHDGKDQLSDAYTLYYSYLATVKDLIKDEEFFFKSI